MPLLRQLFLLLSFPLLIGIFELLGHETARHVDEGSSCFGWW